MIAQITKNNYADTKKDILTERIIGCCFKVHTESGPGFNEKIYHNALTIAFKEEGLVCETEKDYEVFYKDKRVGKFRADLIIEGKVIVEIKSATGKMPAIFESQILSYLKASGLQVGLLVNFGNKSCQVKRFIFQSAQPKISVKSDEKSAESGYESTEFKYKSAESIYKSV